jgi:transposase
MTTRAAPPALEVLRTIPRDQLVSSDEPARFIEAFVESLDLEAFGFVERRHANQRREQPHSPSVLLKVLLFGWFSRIRSYRPLEKACHVDLRFLYLTACDPPARSTLNRFWSDHHRLLPALFEHLVRCARDAGLVGTDLHALDGTKIRAACSMHTAVHRDTEKNA